MSEKLDNVILSLSYLSDPTNPLSPLLTCQQNCTLPPLTANIPYIDFLFPPGTLLTGLELDIFSFHGPGAGLHLLQLLSEGAVAYAAVEANGVACATGVGATGASSLSTAGDWTAATMVSGSFPGTLQSVLTVALVGGPGAGEGKSLMWSPYIAQAGLYTLSLVTPGCTAQGDCAARTTVDVRVSTRGGGNTTLTTLDQATPLDLVSVIYSGYLSPSLDLALDGRPNFDQAISVVLSLASGGAPVEGKNYHIVADSISLLALTPNGASAGPSSTVSSSRVVTSHGLYEYDLTSEQQNPRGLNHLGSLLAPGARVAAIVHTNSTAAPLIFIGGEFVYNNVTLLNSTAQHNFLLYSVATDTVLSPTRLSFNGPVTSLQLVPPYVYAAGNFSSTSDNLVRGLAGLARLDYTAANLQWEALSSSPGSQVGSINTLAAGVNASLLILGSTGMAVYPGPPGTRSQSGLIAGNLTAASLALRGGLYLVGDLVALSTTATAAGGAVVSQASGGAPSLTAFGFGFQQPSPQSTRPARRLISRLSDSVVVPLTRRTPLAVDSRSPALLSLAPVGATAEILTGAFWTRGALSLLILAGHFTTLPASTFNSSIPLTPASNSSLQNIGLYDPVTRNFTALGGLDLGPSAIIKTLCVPGGGQCGLDRWRFHYERG